jgi:hypothetical protein
MVMFVVVVRGDEKRYAVFFGQLKKCFKVVNCAISFYTFANKPPGYTFGA